MSTLISPATSFIASANIDGTYLVTDKTACMTGVRDYPELRFERVTEEWIKNNLDYDVSIYCMNGEKSHIAVR